MTVSLEGIRQKITPRFPQVEQVDESVLRFERASRGSAYAVCYVDVSKKIPESAESLNRYQERVVACRYFQGRKSLQWSNYVYFVVDEQPPQTTKVFVERDRKYARKFILTEPEFDTALSPPTLKVPDSVLKTDILTTWINILADAQLDRAILNDEPLPRRLELIESFFAKGSASPPAANVVPKAAPQPFLRHISLKQFRAFPAQREFDFGKVTLFCGANGTGKTSLLEAIELVYCGRNKRNPKAGDNYRIVAGYADGSEENAVSSRPTSLFRNRSLTWYGQSELKTSNLYQAFSRFNFLNTDAAVGLAEDKDSLEEDLSKLLVGPEASKTWREIERTADKLDDRIKELASLLNQAELEESSLTRQIAASGELKQESGAVLKKLDERLESLGGRRSESDPISSVKTLIEGLSEYEIHAKAAIACEWVGAPVTLTKLRQFVAEAEVKSAACEGLLTKHREGTLAESQCAAELEQIEENLHDLTELRRYIEAGLVERVAEMERLSGLIAAHGRMFAGVSVEGPQPHLLTEVQVSVEELSKTTADGLATASLHLSEAEKRFSDFNALRNESESLLQRLRDVSAQILERSDDPDKCPLCNTRFGPGELSKHIHAGVDSHLEETAAALLADIREKQSQADLATSKVQAATRAEKVCRRLGQHASIPVSELLKLTSEALRENLERLEERARISAELVSLEASGLRADRYRQLLEAVSSRQTVPSREEIEEECNKLEATRSSKASELNSHRIRNQVDLKKAAETLAIVEAKAASVASALAQLKEQVASTRSVLANLVRSVASFPLPADRPISELAISIGAVRSLAGDYQTTHSKEQNAIAVLAEASGRKTQVETQIAGLRPRIERLTQARATLTTIQGEHSLSGAMDDALRQNRNAIEAIFARIHSPAEFSGLGDTLTALVRKSDRSTATLQQVSTGQRAAFALSLFLAQNVQLRTAPPLILIDDPIAHVDDLNCLSFLDYLREVIVGGDRQVVFATANEKLATLFERKFDFLGQEEFRRYDLRR